MPVTFTTLTANSVMVGVSLLLLILATPASATISFMDSSKIYTSHPDRHIGQPLLGGYQYMGRMQYVPDNPTLCPGKLYPQQKFDIVTPTDGLPVALIAQSGGCSFLDKVKVASSMITPSNTVGYLIVQDASKRHKLFDDDAGNGNHDSIYGDAPFVGSLQSVEYLDYLKLAEQNGRELIQLPEDDGALELELELELLRQQQLQLQLEHHPKPSSSMTLEGDFVGDLNLAVLHVSFGTGLALFDALVRESPVDKRQGGKRVLLNGKESAFFLNPVLAWILIISFCCLLLCVHKAFDIEYEQEPPEAPRRPRRRRLTLEEVRTRFPSYHFHPGQQQQQQQYPNNTCCPSGTTCEAACEQEQHEQQQEQQQQQHGGYMQLSDECTICLDEFAPGVRVRKLPCDHIFHSTCIARWLIERSAVCPLCKLDLYIEPEEEDESDSNSGSVSQQQLLLQHGRQPQDSLLSVWRRSWTNTTLNTNNANSTNEGYTQLEVPSGAPSENDIANGVEEQRSWWPFSLEIVPSTDEEERSELEANTNNLRSASSSLLATAAFALSSWTRDAFSFGTNNRHQDQDHNDTSNLTELTEPLVSQASVEEEQQPQQPQLQPSPTAADRSDASSE